MAAKLVRVTYKNITKPILTTTEAKADLNRVKLWEEIPANQKGDNIKKIICGTGNIYTQFVLSMETQVCVTELRNDYLEVKSATQWMDVVQHAVSRALKINQSRLVT